MSRRSRRRIILSFALWSAVGSMACEAVSPPSLSTIAADGDYIGQQGRLVLGFRGPDIRTFRFPTAIVGVRVAANGELIASGMTGRDFKGVTLQSLAGPLSIDLRIVEVDRAGPDGDWEYMLEQWEASSGKWEPACAEPIPVVPLADPPASPPRAIAMRGWWTAAGVYVDDANTVSFACRTGVAAKCHGWGYPVTADPPDTTQTGHPTPATGGDMMLACTRMARADFCGGGFPGTFDGTPIHLHDVFGGPVPHDPDVPGFTFEAAWPAVAGGGRRAIRGLPALCLTKLRWSTLPLGGSCPLALPDPRIDGKGTFCEEYKLSDLEAEGALLYSGSMYLDAGLYTFADPPTSARFTTTRLVPGDAGEGPEWLLPPPAGLDFPQPDQPVQFEAAIFSPDLPPSVPRDGLMPLVSHRCGDGDYVTTTAEPPMDCSRIAHEGFVYAPNAAGRTSLRRWWDPEKRRSFTTTTSPTTMIDDGWELAEVVGGVVSAAPVINVRWSRRPQNIYSLDLQTRTGEWIAPCINSAQIGASTMWRYRGLCTSAANRQVNPTDIAAFRVAYAVSGPPFQTVTLPYDGVATDLHVDLPAGETTAVALTWSDKGPGATYALDVMVASSGQWIEGCATDLLLANGTQAVYTGRCPSAGVPVPIQDIKQLRICAAFDRNWDKPACSEVPYDGVRSTVDFLLQ